MNEMIFKDGKKIGEINIDKSYYLSFRNEKHVFRIFGDGFGISEKVLDLLFSKNIEIIIIVFNGETVYYTYLNSFVLNAKEYIDNKDKQLILEMKYWKNGIDNLRQERLTL